jgi:hypothetical protein
MAAPLNDCGLLYHLVQQELWESVKAEHKDYYPPTFESDGERRNAQQCHPKAAAGCHQLVRCTERHVAPMMYAMYLRTLQPT